MTWHVKVHDSAQSVDASSWSRLLGDEGNRCPFLRRDFFVALEESGAASSETGWQPAHLILEKDGDARALLPLYAKSHSYGEYVFDHAWARAFEQAGGRYYPKLLSAIPFTPVPGQRLITPHQDQLGDMFGVLAQWLDRQQFSSFHLLFARGEANETKPPFMLRKDLQFHWHNRNYKDFDDFLAALNSRKRKQIRKERAKVQDSGLRIEFLCGDDIKPEHWDGFCQAHDATVDRKWGQAYLNRDTFALLQERMGSCLRLSAAFDGDKMVAGAWSMCGSDSLFGRQWGCIKRLDGLHFELCYYQTIEHAISHNLSHVEAGVQGEHKIARGFEPVATHSIHYVQHLGLADAVANFLRHETGMVDRAINEYQEMTPFRKEDG